MKTKYLILALGLVFQASAHSASFTAKGEVVASSTSVKTIDCDIYKVDLVHESFPLKFENYVPSEFRVDGFYGSSTTISKQAIIQPAGLVVPNPNDIDELKNLYLEGRTYLAGSAVCQGSLLIVSYWSGGNCSQCEAFVSFEYSDSKLSNPKIVTYREFKSLSK
ncbi:hypothetical protein [Glaciecola sp. SC05]|uniref:hypothetical protein n=1 Tax=Glaciecola sp. SC05 TaxID=1987355 RepID=UPI0035271814